MDTQTNSIHQLFYQCEVDVSLQMQENKNRQSMPNPAALTARCTDVNSSSSEASEPVATDLFFWNKNIVIKLLPAPSKMLKLEGTTGCIIIHPKSMDKAQLSTAAFAYFPKKLFQTHH